METTIETATLIKYEKSKAQEEKLTQIIFSDCFIKVSYRPTLINGNLLVKTTDEFGREGFFELTPMAEKVKTTLWF